MLEVEKDYLAVQSELCVETLVSLHPPSIVIVGVDLRGSHYHLARVIILIEFCVLLEFKQG